MAKQGSKRVLVTGATRGLGRSLVDRLIEQQVIVAGCGRSAAAIAELSTAHRSPNRFDVVDVANARSVEQWADRILSEWGVPDLVVNNAALINKNAPLWGVPEQEFSEVIDVNIKGVFHVIRSFLPAMISRGSGVVANLSSGWGRATSPEVAPYCATKWAIEGLTQALAQELPPGLAAVPLNPGIINTEMLQSCFGKSASKYPDADEWSRIAAPFLLNLGPRDNGKALTVPIND